MTAGRRSIARVLALVTLTMVVGCRPAAPLALVGTYRAFNVFFKEWHVFIRIDEGAGTYRISAMRDGNWSPPMNLRDMTEDELRQFLPELLDQSKMRAGQREAIYETLKAADLGLQAFMTADGMSGLLSIGRGWTSGDLELKPGVFLLTGMGPTELRKD